jgi:hypothetical protein
MTQYAFIKGHKRGQIFFHKSGLDNHFEAISPFAVIIGFPIFHMSLSIENRNFHNGV